MTLIYRFLGRPALRTVASETLANIISKKMSSGDKLEMITFLNLTQVVDSLDADEDVEFAEAMARLVNVQGLELTSILLEVIPNRVHNMISLTLGKLFVRSWIQNRWSFAGIASFTAPVSIERVRRYQSGCIPILDRPAFPSTGHIQSKSCAN